jgi:putative DNA primase/helicase
MASREIPMSLDFAGINARLLASAEHYVQQWIPGGKLQGAEYVVTNPKRADGHKGSFKINCDEGVWKDYASGDGGADLISLYAWLNNLKQGEAARTLMAELGMIEDKARPSLKGGSSSPGAAAGEPEKKRGRPKWTPIIPARPAGAEPPAEHFKMGKPSTRWEYRTADGALFGYVYRFDPPGERKQIMPVVWARNESGREEWRWLGFPKPRPLYGIDQALHFDGSPIIVTEGEKAADAAKRLMPDYVAITSQGGSKAPKESDWSLLKNRDVLIWPDNDPEGFAYAAYVAEVLQAQGCKVQRLKIPADWPEKYDAADFEADGRPIDWLHEQLASGAIVEVVQTQAGRVAADCPIASGSEPWPTYHDGEFSISRGGVFRSSGHTTEPICLRPIWVEAMTENLYGAAGVLVKFLDRRWRLREYAFPASRFNESGGVLGQELQIQDCPVCPGKEKWISRYLNAQSANITNYLRSVHRMGWVDSLGAPVFVLPQQVMGQPDIPIVYQPVDLSSLMDCISIRGSVQGWQENVAAKAKGNPFLMFGIMMGLASALLKPARVEMGGFHFYGLTTGGKTTMLQVAASVWGCGADPQQGPEETSVRKWASTPAAFESMAEAHNDTLLCLDELEQAPAEDLGKNVFLLAGGLSKNRSNVAGGLRAVKTWRVMICSSGEKSIRHQMAMAGHEYKGGKAVRLADIPVDGDDGQRSIFRETHGDAPKMFGWKLKASCAEHFGLAGPMFVAALIAEAMRIGWLPFCALLREELSECEKSLGPPKRENPLPPEGDRVLTRFALIAQAGMRARMVGLLDWSIEDIIFAVRYVRDRWLSNLGEERSEQDRALAHLRDQIIANESRLVWLNKTDGVIVYLERDKSAAKLGQVRNVMGFRTKDEFGFTSAGFRELCGEYDMRMVLNSLKAAGFLVTDKDRMTRKWPKIPGYEKSRPYLYSIKSEFMGDPDNEDVPLAAGGCPF